MAAKKAAAAAPEEKPKRTRVVLSPAEKIAKIERDLEAARQAQHDQEQKLIDKLLEKRTKLVDQIGEREAKVVDLNEQLQLLGYDDDQADTGETVEV